MMLEKLEAFWLFLICLLVKPVKELSNFGEFSEEMGSRKSIDCDEQDIGSFGLSFSDFLGLFHSFFVSFEIDCDGGVLLSHVYCDFNVGIGVLFHINKMSVNEFVLSLDFFNVWLLG